MSLVRSAFLAVLIAGLSLPALAQTVVRVRGTIEALDGNTLMVKTREGPSVKIALADNYTVAAVVPLELGSIAAGSYIGTAAMCKTDGCTALEVLVFPETMKGTGEGRFPWDLAPESTMINAAVSTVAVGAGQGRDLVLTHKGETSKVTVPVGVPIVTFVPAASRCSRRERRCSSAPRKPPTAASRPAASPPARTASPRRCESADGRARRQLAAEKCLEFVPI